MSRANSRVSTLMVLFSGVLFLLFTLPVSAQAPPSADAFVSSAYPSANFGVVNSLAVGTGSTSYIQFNLSGIPAGATVNRCWWRMGKFIALQEAFSAPSRRWSAG